MWQLLLFCFLSPCLAQTTTSIASTTTPAPEFQPDSANTSTPGLVNATMTNPSTTPEPQVCNYTAAKSVPADDFCGTASSRTVCKNVNGLPAYSQYGDSCEWSTQCGCIKSGCSCGALECLHHCDNACYPRILCTGTPAQCRCFTNPNTIGMSTEGNLSNTSISNLTRWSATNSSNSTGSNRSNLSISYAHTTPSAGSTTRDFKVGTCSTSLKPYVHHNSTLQEKVAGFEVDLFSLVWSKMVSEEYASSGANAASDLYNLKSKPILELYDGDSLLTALREGRLDMGFCGIPQTPELVQKFNFLPAHTFSGLQCLMRKEQTVDAYYLVDTFVAFLNGMFLQSSLLIMLILAVACAHIIWLLEGANPGNFNRDYVQGIIDAIWYIFGAACAVGFGDHVTTTLAGRIVSCLCIFVGSLSVAVFTASFNAQLVVGANWAQGYTISVREVHDLVHWRVGIATNAMETELKALAPGVWVTAYGNMFNLLSALMRKDLDVAVVTADSANFIAFMDPSYKDILTPTGPIFGQKTGIGLAMSRNNGTEHPLYELASKALTSVMHGPQAVEFESLKKRWFQPNDQEKYLDEDSLSSIFAKSNFVLWFIILGIVGFWTIVLCVHYRMHFRGNMVRKRIQWILGLKSDFAPEELRAAARDLYCRLDTDKLGLLHEDSLNAFLLQLAVSVAERNQLRIHFQRYALGDLDQEHREHKSRCTNWCTDIFVSDVHTQGPNHRVPPGMSRTSGGFTLTQDEFIRAIERILCREDKENRAKEGRSMFTSVAWVEGRIDEVHRDMIQIKRDMEQVKKDLRSIAAQCDTAPILQALQHLLEEKPAVETKKEEVYGLSPSDVHTNELQSVPQPCNIELSSERSLVQDQASQSVRRQWDTLTTRSVGPKFMYERSLYGMYSPTSQSGRISPLLFDSTRSVSYGVRAGHQAGTAGGNSTGGQPSVEMVSLSPIGLSQGHSSTSINTSGSGLQTRLSQSRVRSQDPQQKLASWESDLLGVEM